MIGAMRQRGGNGGLIRNPRGSATTAAVIAAERQLSSSQSCAALALRGGLASLAAEPCKVRRSSYLANGSARTNANIQSSQRGIWKIPGG